MKLQTKMVPQIGITIAGTWVPYECLEDLQDVHGLEGFEPGCNFPKDIEKALIKEGIAHKSTRGSLFPNMARLEDLIESIEWD